ncbi:MAG: hypothetical protein VKJ24_00655 [Synechococcales bacterium]|nr:hypothetical protein [Synechococcales bacterium]
MPKRIFATAVTKSHLADARTLAASLAAHHPDSELYVLLADRMEGMFDPIQEPFHLIQLSDLSDRDRIDRMCFYYNAFELCCALRGDLHEYLWQHTQVDRWLFLDADVWVCHSLEVIFQQLDQAEILLTPHNLQPTLPEHVELRELDFLKLGLYNGGCLGIRRGSASQQFIQWWKSRLTYYSFDDHGIKEIRGLHTDQYLLGLVPLYFDPVVLLRHPGANIGHWNLIDRHLEQTADGKFWVDGQPLLFLHLSGWDIEQPDRVSRYSLLYATYENPAWAILGQCYRAELLSHGYRETRQWSYAFANFETGQPISLAARRAYYHEWQQGQALPASPFQQASLLATASYPTLTSVILLQEERANLMVKLMEQQESTHLAWTKVEELMEMQKDLHHQIQLQDQQIQNLNAQTQALNQQNQALNQQNQLLVQSGQSLLQDIRAISSETVSEPTIAAALTSLRHHKFWRVWKFWVATKNWLKTQITQRRSR